MARRASNLGRLRPLALAVVVATALLAPAGLSGQAAGDDLASPSDPAVVPDPSGASESTAPLPSPPSAAQSTAPIAPPATVTVARASASASKSVSIVDFSFKPGTLTVNAGDTVKWTNDGSVPEGHNVTGDGLDSGLLKSGDSYSHTFSQPGSFSYICTIHPSMKGTVKVLGRSSGNSGNNASSDGSGDGSGGDPSGAASTGTQSGSAAVSAPDAGGSAGSLPATGSDLPGLATLGLMLLNLGLALRVVGPLRPRPRR